MEPDPNPPPNGPRVGPLALWLAAEVLALSLFFSPNERLTRFLYNDSGAELTIPSMVTRGLTPTSHFGYIYGLLPIQLDRIWQGVLGTNPRSFRLAALLCNLLLAWGLARLLAATRAGPAGVALTVVALPDMLQASTIVLVHALEPALLVHALAFQARGRRGWALALATADLFVKPAMAYVYGAAVLAAVVLDPADRSRGARAIAPALAVGGVLAAWMFASFGLDPLLSTLLPGAGLEVYRQNHYGFFFGQGRSFWLIPGGGLRDYLRYEVGAWIAATVVLAAGGAGAALRLARRRGTAADEVAATCAGLHLTFVFLFYGGRVSWVYYYALLVAGLAALTARAADPSGVRAARFRSAAVGLVALLTLVGMKVKVETVVRQWRTDRPTATTYGLWASPAERAEWETVRRMCAEQVPAALLARVEGAAALEPSLFRLPETSYLVPGHPLRPEVWRKADQLRRASTIVRVRPRNDPTRGGFEHWPEIAAALREFRTVWEGEFFEVLRRPEGEQAPGPETPGADEPVPVTTGAGASSHD